MATRRQHWLMKSEPEAFGIADLARVKREPWTGVRNYLARNYMRDLMRVGDDVLIYHSNAKPTGIAGLARIAKVGVVDATQFDPQSPYYDGKSTPAAPRWHCVEVEFVAQFPQVLELAALRHVPGLAGMVLLQKGSRLSVQPVSSSEFRIICSLAQASTSARPSAAMARPRSAR
ncbi:MAG: EVE domain-containing protein [Myxococcales bacterium]|nr:EVE domain-containing protein [Myxococcales bacterium]